MRMAHKHHDNYHAALFDSLEYEIDTLTLTSFREYYAESHAAYFQYRIAVALERLVAIARRMEER